MKRIGVLTGGGDTQALNGYLYAIAQTCEEKEIDCFGFIGGWQGLYSGTYTSLKSKLINPDTGGTITKCSRTNLLRLDNGLKRAREVLEAAAVDVLIPIGGDDTLTVGSALSDIGVPVVCLLKTIDNDAGNGYFCAGFPSAAKRIASYVRDLRTTAYSHNRIIVAEVMGRNAGWLALAGAYGQADFIIIPEVAFNYDCFVKAVKERYLAHGNMIIVVSEAVKDEAGKEIVVGNLQDTAFGHAKLSGVGEYLAQKLKLDLKAELSFWGSSYCHGERLSYWQRSGQPSRLDKIAALELGREAVNAAMQGKLGNVVIADYVNGGFVPKVLPIDRALNRDSEGKVVPRLVDPRFYDPETFGITSAGAKYFKPILGLLPPPYEPPRLEIKQVVIPD